MTGTKLKPPIFLIGNYRSGTTITQNLIGLHPDIVTWYEPRTMWLYADPARCHDEFGERDATEKVVRYIRRQFLSFQSAHGGRKIMENTPSNVLRVPYVHKIFPEAIFLYITRNPFSVISSMELKWQRTKTLRGMKRTIKATPVTQLHYHVGTFIKQLLIKRVLGKKYIPVYGPRYIGINEDLKELGTLRVIARQWARGNQRAREDLSRLGKSVLFIRYEDLMQEPEAVLRCIYDHCGLDCSDEIVRAAKQMIDPTRQEKWLRLDPEKLKAVLPEIQEEMRVYGYEVPPALR